MGTTPNCLIQRDNETGDLIVHARNTLNRSFEMTGKEDALAISYPFKAVGGVGLVRDADHDKQAEMGMDHQHSHQQSRQRESNLEMGHAR